MASHATLLGRGCRFWTKMLNLHECGGYSSVAERRSVDPDVVGSIPTSRPKPSAERSSRWHRYDSGISQRSKSDASSPDIMTRPRSKHAGHIYLGCSGWAYPSWKPGFYPPKTSTKKLLPYYASQLNSVEVNYTFRQLPSLSTVQGWLAAVNDDFCFSFKAPQGITHHKRLVDCVGILERFYEALQPVVDAGRMGLVLFQLPPNFKVDTARLSTFLHECQDSDSHRIAFEFRHESWFTEEVFAVLKRHNAALCIAESDAMASPDMVTADFRCYRLRKTDYSPGELRGISENLIAGAVEGDVFAYFKHEDAPTGPIRAREVLAKTRESQ